MGSSPRSRHGASRSSSTSTSNSTCASRYDRRPRHHGRLRRVSNQLADVLHVERFMLLERMATRVAEIVLEHPRVDAVTVVARKLRPPVPQHIDTTGVRLRRSR
ncbi:MAG: dihydroneopterin aldolase [Acidimicrobiales bacterium]